MDLKEIFKEQSKNLAAGQNMGAPSVEVLKAPKRKKMSTGVRTIFDYDSFKFIITYFESGRAAYAQQTIWLSVSLDEDMVLPYSIYDVLVFCEPKNFKSYTYSYVDSPELMKRCFEEIEELIINLAPKFTELLSDGVTRNKFISTQKQAVNKYFGDNVLESAEMVGGAADKIISFMLENFYEAQMESAVIGSQALFYTGKEEKALKYLRKAKCRTLYQENLMKYLENGGKNTFSTETQRQASPENGSSRHAKGELIIIPYIILITILITIITGSIYLGIISLVFRDSVVVLGVYENFVVLPVISFGLSVPASLSLLIKKKEKLRKKDSEKVYSPPVSPKVKNFVKYLVLVSEAIAVIVVSFCIFSTAVFNDNEMLYSENDYPLSFESCSYEGIEEICIVKGYYYENEFVKEEYIAVKTISGRVIDLYNSSFMSTEKVKDNTDFFKDKGITVKEYKSDRALTK